MKLIDLLQKCEYTLDSGSLDVNIKDVIYDSRKVVRGCAFVALKGYNVDGHKFIPDAVERGAKALIVEDEGIAYDGVTVVRVKDARATVRSLPSARRVALETQQARPREGSASAFSDCKGATPALKPGGHGASPQLSNEQGFLPTWQSPRGHEILP